MKHLFFVVLLCNLTCAAPKPIDPDIWRPRPGEELGDRIPGPLKNFGPFDSFADALEAACPRILTKPNATMLHLLGNNSNPDRQDLKTALRFATEYCDWLYYTPDHKYKLSMISNLEEPGDDLNMTATCKLPPSVDDPAYSPNSIKYIFYLHNHPFAGELSDRDINLAVEMANAHELVVDTKNQKVPFAVIAFFSNARDGEKPTCDGFYQYIPATRELLRWTQSEGHWKGTKTGIVIWESPTQFTIMR
ncbi:MAG: hypothetical protein ACJ8AT_37550 [Hyalangium sp.]|uniref:hypothetical protein n=1 Tax=Hyalangium sp. TaxID=2028555 RepID=UPI00389A2E9B